jgi:gentisate 1,2-dioxygenase
MSFILSCKTTNEFQYKRTEFLIIKDTIVIPSVHHHCVGINGDNRCVWIPSIEYPYTDTIKIEFVEPNYKNKNI